VAASLRRLVAKINKLSGTITTDESFRETIRKFNRLRELSREATYLYWDAETPPLSSSDFRSLQMTGNEPYLDVDATISVMEEAVVELRTRIENGVRGLGIAPNAPRLFICGSCVTANPHLVDKAGGIVIGHDDGWSETVTHVDEEGDPYANLAKAILSYPYELPTKERALWTVEQVRRSRADGLLFIYNWGCNFQSSSARLIVDVVRDEAKIPTTHIGSSEAGRSESVAQFQNRVEAFIEMLRFRKGFARR
jgi:benzoyl-CoA reductase/2-hydroxyglutaryl-CoA dehydratase subunit BcrC/BadD/HgdB